MKKEQKSASKQAETRYLGKLKLKVNGTYNDYESLPMRFTEEEFKSFKDILIQAIAGDLPVYVLETKDGSVFFGPEAMASAVATLKVEKILAEG